MAIQDGGSKMADPRWRIQDGGSKMADPRWRTTILNYRSLLLSIAPLAVQMFPRY